jgi:hypothetical protein
MHVLADLHGHTFFSDARSSPEEYVRFRKERGLELIAISDHDVMWGVRRGAEVACELGVQLLPAVECTTHLDFGTDTADQIHVLAYFPPSILEGDRLERTALFGRSRRFSERWKAFVLAWLEELGPEERGALDQGWSASSGGEFPGLQRVLDAIQERAPARIDEFRIRQLDFWCGDRELFGWTPEEAIETIRADGAVDVIAHPGRYRDQARVLRLMAHATGVEVYTTRHRPSLAAEYRTFCDSRRKLWTSGSDDHQIVPYVLPERPMSEEVRERLIG